LIPTLARAKCASALLLGSRVHTKRRTSGWS
jgi:hypothetical protein